MLSGVGPRNHLERYRIPVLLNLPVGDNYEVHTDMRTPATLSNSLTINNLDQYYFNRSGPLSEVPYLALYSNTSSFERDWPNVKFNFIANPFTPQIDSVLIEMQRIRSRGTVRLQSVSPYIPPMITPNFLSDPRDFADAIEMVKFFLYVTQLPDARTIFAQNYLQSAGCQSCPGVADYLCDSGITCFIRRSTYTSWHSGGTCRMGAVERNDVVVDPCLRVKNARNLRVCDGSIFPALPNANTNAAIHMVGEKCADLIKQDHFI